MTTISDPTNRGSLRIPLRTSCIVAEVADEYGIGIDDILGRNRSRKFSWPRQKAYARLHREANMPKNQIKGVFCVHHTSVMYGIKSYDNRVELGMQA